MDEAALRHNAGAEHETSEPTEAYANVNRRAYTPYREGWLPE